MELAYIASKLWSLKSSFQTLGRSTWGSLYWKPFGHKVWDSNWEALIAQVLPAVDPTVSNVDNKK